MRQICLAAILTVILGPTAFGGQTHAIHGLFCNTEAELDQALALMAERISPQSAAELVNKTSVACVFADKVRYVVRNPVIIGKPQNGYALIKYHAVLVGVAVGQEVRPLLPPADIYFLVPQRLEGAVTVGGA